MQPYQYAILGLVLDILGAFLLAAEAIRLDNLRALQKKLFPLEKLLLRSEYTTSEARLQAILGVVAVSAIVVWVANEFGITARTLVPELISYITGGTSGEDTLKRLLGIGLLAVMVATVWLPFGVFMHAVLLLTTWIAIAILEFIDRHTPSGAVGILGLALLFVGFAMQAYAAWLGGHLSQQ